MSQSVVCKACGVNLVREPDVGFVDATPVADGGMYDICPKAAGLGPHSPKPVHATT